jgi:hypothetical protein
VNLYSAGMNRKREEIPMIPRFDGVGRVRLSYERGEDNADQWVPASAKQGREARGSSGFLGRPTWARERSGGSGLGSSAQQRGKEGAGQSAQASRLPAVGKLFPFFYICFPNHLNRFSNPNQIKSKPHHTIKQMQ